MNTNNAAQIARKKPKAQLLISAIIFFIGLALMIFMITTESEPGALPLLLVVVGITWHLIPRFRFRRVAKA